MKTAFVSLVLVIVCGSLAAAQQPGPRRAIDRQITPANITPEMWHYTQEQRRHDDPQQAVRRKAELATQLRTERLAAMKWYGMSNARPIASGTPWMSGMYSPAWVGNGQDRYDWVGLGWPRTAGGYVSPAFIVR
jgi:hypothetical protein